MGPWYFFFILWIVAHNWGSPEIYKALGSVFIGGLIALLIALLTILRGSEEQRRFVSSVVIDGRTHLPVGFAFWGHPLPDVSDPPEQRVAVRHAILGQLAKRGEPPTSSPTNVRMLLLLNFLSTNYSMILRKAKVRRAKTMWRVPMSKVLIDSM